MEKKRAARRAATRRICERRRRIWLAMSQSWCCDITFEPGRLNKATGWSCNCRKSRKGAPRKDVGMCRAGARDHIYTNRAANLKLKNLICSSTSYTEEALNLALMSFR